MANVDINQQLIRFTIFGQLALTQHELTPVDLMPQGALRREVVRREAGYQLPGVEEVDATDAVTAQKYECPERALCEMMLRCLKAINKNRYLPQHYLTAQSISV